MKLYVLLLLFPLFALHAHATLPTATCQAALETLVDGQAITIHYRDGAGGGTTRAYAFARARMVDGKIKLRLRDGARVVTLVGTFSDDGWVIVHRVSESNLNLGANLKAVIEATR